MKRRKISIIIVCAIAAIFVLAGCGQQKGARSGFSGSATAPAPASTATGIVEDENGVYDFSEQAPAELAAMKFVPDAASIPLSVEDEKGATGVVLVSYPQLEGENDYYLNALVAGNALQIRADGQIKSAESSASGALTIQDNAISVVPAAISAADPVDEIISVELEDGTKYNIHTYNALLPDIDITGTGVAPENAGIYSILLDGFMIRVNTDGQLVYYRDTSCTGEEVDNFASQEVDGKMYYTIFVNLHKYTMSMHGTFLVMDENYKDLDQLLLAENQDTAIPHKVAYLEPHEFIVLEEGHYLTLCYMPIHVSNLPDDVEGINGTKEAYVWAGLIQEVKDGKVLMEYNTASDPVYYSNAVERIDFAGSTDEAITGIKDTSGRQTSFFGLMDYTHINSLDYVLDAEGNIAKLLISMRMQSAVYQIDAKTGTIDWVLGGKGSTLSGYDEFAKERQDDKGVTFNALTFGQHYAKYMNKNADGTLTGNPVISVFDNQTGVNPFLTTLDPPTLTRTMVVTIDEAAKTAAVSDVINGTDLNKLSDKYHIASHCGTVRYINDHSVLLGWGFHIMIDEAGPDKEYGSISDEGYPDLRIGSKPIFTEYDPTNNIITFELSAVRNPDCEPPATSFFSYRVYKAAR